MASQTDPAGLTPDQLRTIDQARQRLDQLTKSIEAVRKAVALGQPMPDLAALSAHSTILTQTTTSLTTHLSQHADLLSTIVAYPSPNFPGRTQEHLAGQLLRKKLEPGVEAWVGEGRVVGEMAEKDGERGKVGGAHADRDRLEEDWRWVAGWTVREAKGRVDGSREVGEEMEESSDEEEGESDEDGDVDMEGQTKERKLEEAIGGAPDPNGVHRTVPMMVRFMNTGVMP